MPSSPSRPMMRYGPTDAGMGVGVAPRGVALPLGGTGPDTPDDVPVPASTLVRVGSKSLDWVTARKYMAGAGYTEVVSDPRRTAPGLAGPSHVAPIPVSSCPLLTGRA